MNYSDCDTIKNIDVVVVQGTLVYLCLLLFSEWLVDLVGSIQQREHFKIMKKFQRMKQQATEALGRYL